MATNELAATATISPFASVVRPSRTIACATIATTAAASPANAPATHPRSPCVTKSQDRPRRRKKLGSTNAIPATRPPRTRWRSQPTYVASCIASGPGSSMQKLSACRNRPSSIHRRRSTSSWCINAICPAGPPKFTNPSHIQKRDASRNVGVLGASAGGDSSEGASSRPRVRSPEPQEEPEPEPAEGQEPMQLTPTEEDRLRVFTAAQLARSTLANGLRLNAPEAVALVCDEMHAAGRGGGSFDEVAAAGRDAVRPDQVMDGVTGIVPEIRVEVLLEEGTRLFVLREPFGPAGADAPGAIRFAEGDIELAPGRERIHLTVTNRGEHPIRVSSHFPFWRANEHLEFDREAADGFRLDLPAGDSLRWAPGEAHEVDLVRYGGTGA